MKNNLSLLILLLTLMATPSYSSKDRNVHNHNVKNKKANHYSQTTMHNVTIDCGDKRVLRRTVATCQWDLVHLSSNQSVWSGRDIRRKVWSNRNAINGSDNLKDSLDSLDHMCYINDRSRKCLKENGICDYCLNTANALLIEMDTQFLCHHQRRDENLVRTLQCLSAKRVLVMLFFHIGNHCFQGMEILDDLMSRMKNQYFYTLGVNRTAELPHIITPLYCLPKNVISTCVRGIIEDHCGKRSA